MRKLLVIASVFLGLVFLFGFLHFIDTLPESNPQHTSWNFRGVYIDPFLKEGYNMGPEVPQYPIPSYEVEISAIDRIRAWGILLVGFDNRESFFTGLIIALIVYILYKFVLWSINGFDKPIQSDVS